MSKNKRTKITKTTIKSLPPQGDDWFIRDTQQPGFQIKIPPSGNASYQVEARMGGTGKVKKHKLGNVLDIELEEARDRAKDALDKIRSNIDPLEEKRKKIHEGMTLQQVLDDHIKTARLKQTTQKQYLYLVNKFFKNWLDRRVVDITNYEIRSWYVNSTGTPVETDNAFRVLNTLMNSAVDSLQLMQQNPCHMVTKKIRHTMPKRDRHIEMNHDLSKFLTAFIHYDYQKDSQKVARDVLLLMLMTGLRSENLRSIKWSYINWDKKWIIIPDTKNNLPHKIPLIPLTYNMLQYRKEHADNSEYVFRIMGGHTKSPYITDLRKTLKGICEKAGLTDDYGNQLYIRPHDIRRTFATALNSIDVGIVDLKHLMHHKSKDVTLAIYTQPNTEKLRDCLTKLARFYDLEIPFIQSPPQGYSKYCLGTLRYALYGKGGYDMIEADDPYESEPGYDSYQQEREREYWEGH